jgi:hypothetical protein
MSEIAVSDIPGPSPYKSIIEDASPVLSRAEVLTGALRTAADKLGRSCDLPTMASCALNFESLGIARCEHVGRSADDMTREDVFEWLAGQLVALATQPDALLYVGGWCALVDYWA